MLHFHTYGENSNTIQTQYTQQIHCWYFYMTSWYFDYIRTNLITHMLQVQQLVSHIMHISVVMNSYHSQHHQFHQSSFHRTASCRRKLEKVERRDMYCLRDNSNATFHSRIGHNASPTCGKNDTGGQKISSKLLKIQKLFVCRFCRLFCVFYDRKFENFVIRWP